MALTSDYPGSMHLHNDPMCRAFEDDESIHGIERYVPLSEILWEHEITKSSFIKDGFEFLYNPFYPGFRKIYISRIFYESNITTAHEVLDLLLHKGFMRKIKENQHV